MDLTLTVVLLVAAAILAGVAAWRSRPDPAHGLGWLALAALALAFLAERA